MRNILVLTPTTDDIKKQLQKAAGHEFIIHYLNDQNPASEYEFHTDHLQEEIQDAEIIIGEPSIEQIKDAPKLRLIQMTWAGTDIYTTRPGFPEHVLLTNASGAFGNTISEYVLGAILAQYRQFPYYLRNQQKHMWADGRHDRSLEGKRVLIMGAGDIGCHIAEKLRPFYTYIVGIRRTIRAYPDFFDEMKTMDDLDEEITKADIVIGCLPNTSKTRGLLNESRLSLLKEEALLINVGRGSLIDLEALVALLQRRPDLSVTLDVMNPEPLPQDSPLWDMPNVMLTPHISGPSFGYEQKTWDKLYAICCDNLRRYSNGEPLCNLVDMKEGYRKNR